MTIFDDVTDLMSAVTADYSTDVLTAELTMKMLDSLRFKSIVYGIRKNYDGDFNIIRYFLIAI